MEIWKYFDITHRDHVFCNPLSSEKVNELLGLLELKAGARVLDIACGKGEMLVLLAEQYSIEGVGVDLSPYVCRDARLLAEKRAPKAPLQFIEKNGANYAIPPGEEPFDLAMCIGASWIWKGCRGTLQALSGFVKKRGLVLLGEPFWKNTPPEEYLSAAELKAEDFATHHGNVAIGEEESLTFLYALVSSDDDWDRYEGLQYRAAERYAIEHPDDPDTKELLSRIHKSRDAYLQWGRSCLGWAVYLFQR